MAFEGIYMLGDLRKRKDLDFAGAPVPQFGPRRAVWAGSHNLCLRADLKGKDLEAARRFIKFISDNSLDWAAGGQIPARRDLRDTDRFRGMTVQSAFATQIPYAVYIPRVPFEFEFQSEMDLAIEKALRGTLTPKQALDEATSRIDRIIARNREDIVAARRSAP
jgi:multiple sugar transport system substrate-binding protein